MKYMLIIFMAAVGGDGVNPMVMEEIFRSRIMCENAGAAMRSRQPKRIVWFNCEPLQDTVGDE